MTNRDSKEYRLGEKIVHLEQALNTANQQLKKDGKLGVLPNRSVRFVDGNRFHKKVREVINSVL